MWWKSVTIKAAIINSSWVIIAGIITAVLTTILTTNTQAEHNKSIKINIEDSNIVWNII